MSVYPYDAIPALFHPYFIAGKSFSAVNAPSSFQLFDGDGIMTSRA
jgi:hypothetical protein